MFNQLSTNPSLPPARTRLSALVGDLPTVQHAGPWDAEIDGITTDSRAVRPRWMFVAVEGEHVDGHRYVQVAVERGAGCVVVQRRQFSDGLDRLLTAAYLQHNAATALVVEDTRAAVAVLADRFYGSPAKRLRLVGITGTNGKTTTSYLVKSVLEAAGERVGLIGTVEYVVGRRARPATFTTPPAEELHRIFAEMREAGCTSVVMEVSSHALALRRVHGLRYAASVFTNLTQDHLDFHGSLEAYAAAKALLFRRGMSDAGILNADDPASALMGAELGRRARRYGRASRAAFRITAVSARADGTTVTIRHGGEETVIRSPLAGAFNAYNLAAAFAAGRTLGVPAADAVRGLRRVRTVPGRFERIRSADGVTAIVDYAHSPDALEKAIASARALAGRGRVIVVFGCGGDRDRGKRPLMAAVATGAADVTVVTSDNPRSEDPAAIIRDVLRGARPGSAVRRILDRRAAIRAALRQAAEGDIVLVAGKGHETTQTVGSRRRHFDDREIVRAEFARTRGGVRR